MDHWNWKETQHTRYLTAELTRQFALLKIGERHKQDMKAQWTQAAHNYSLLGNLWTANGNVIYLDRAMRDRTIIHLPQGASIHLLNIGARGAMREHAEAFFALGETENQKGDKGDYPPIGIPTLPGQAWVDNLVRHKIGCDDFGIFAVDILFFAAMFAVFGCEPLAVLFGLIGATLELIHHMECGG